MINPDDVQRAYDDFSAAEEEKVNGAPPIGAMVKAPNSGSKYTVRWSDGDLLTIGDSPRVQAWPHMVANGWKVV